MSARLSDHGAERMGERMGLNASASERMARRALERGIKHSETAGRLRRWCDGLYLSQRNANNLRLYGEHAYLFAGETLVTVLLIPRKLRGHL